MTSKSRRERIMLYVITAIAAGFLLITLFVYFFPDSVIDHQFSTRVQAWRNPLLDAVMKAVSWFGYMPNTPVMITVTAIIFTLFQYKKEAIFILLTSLSGAVSTIIKLLIDRPRPSEPLVTVMLKTQQQSFPSGHVLFYVVFFGFLTLLMFEIRSIPNYVKIPVIAICALLIFTVPYSRVYLGAHWFTDVIAGFMLGLICLYILGSIYIKHSRGQKNA
jgi:membrane-associated phospholipid phosphatase